MHYTDPGSSLIGKKILCTATNFEKPQPVRTKSRHGHQRMRAYGTKEKPAYAVIVIPLPIYTKIKCETYQHFQPNDEIVGIELLTNFEKNPQMADIHPEKRATLKGEPAEAIINKSFEWIGEK